MLSFAWSATMVTWMWGQPTQRQCSSGHHKLGLQVDPKDTGCTMHRGTCRSDSLFSCPELAWSALTRLGPLIHRSLDWAWNLHLFLISCPRMVLHPPHSPSLLKDTIWDKPLGFFDFSTRYYSRQFGELWGQPGGASDSCYAAYRLKTLCIWSELFISTTKVFIYKFGIIL